MFFCSYFCQTIHSDSFFKVIKNKIWNSFSDSVNYAGRKTRVPHCTSFLESKSNAHLHHIPTWFVLDLRQKQTCYKKQNYTLANIYYWCLYIIVYWILLLEFYLLSKRLISKRSTFAEIVDRLSILFAVMFSILFHIRFIMF